MLTQSDDLIWDLWLSQYWLPCMQAADQVGLFVELTAGPAGCEELATRLNLDERVTGAVLQLLTSLKLLTKQDDLFRLTRESASYLIPNEPAYWGPALGIGPPSKQVETIIKALTEGTEAATGTPNSEGVPQPGESALPIVGWARGEVAEERAPGIGRVMHSHSVPVAEGLARRISLRGATHVLDVGGGSGCFSIALCRQHSELSCTVLELEGMCPVPRRYIEEAGLQSRIDTVACNMFTEDWPVGADTVLFSNVLHDWRRESCQLLLQRAFRTLPPGGQVWIHEMLLDGDQRCAAAFSLMMVLGTQGQQFTSSELQGMLSEAGFEDLEVYPAAGYYSLVRGRKP